jgi:hypothetical protein
LWSLHTYLVTALTCHFGTFLQCAQQPSGTFLCGFYVAFNMLKLVGDIPIMKKAAVSIFLVSTHILHLILETDLYLYSHNDCILQDFKAALTVSIEDLKPVREMLCEFILKETLDPKGNFYSAFYL